MCQLDDTHAIAGQTPAWKHEELSKNLYKKHDKLRQRGTQNGLNDSHGHECLSVFSYGPEPALEKSSLSIRLMHKPPRAQKELEKASNPTRRNSLTNSITPQDTQYDIISPTDHPSSQDTSGCASPSNLTPSGSPTQPNLVRKKSGEIVKPLLKDRASSISLRSRSLPSTPTYKQVHFGGDNDVRYFKKKDRPTAISAQSSPKPVEVDDDDEEADIPSLEFDLQADRHMRSLFNPNRKSYFEYYDEELNSHVDHEEEVVTRTTQGSKLSSSEDWQLALLNFPNEPNSQENIEINKPVFLENIFLSTDKRYLLGRIAVLNLAYQKSVTIRYSLDNWCTIVEIQATYIPDCPALLRTHNYERFMFKIPLDSFFNGFYTSVDPLSNSHSELCPELCVKYVVHGQELWDNNQGGNYRFKLKKEPNLQIMSAEVPNSARTKQEVHKKRPKYSSSYLKKIKSDSALSHNMGTMSLEDSSYVSSQIKGSHFSGTWF
ncbi:hypothetical protein JCM33374_g6557 [Metschnikowia sp. JCM 33374]|nr:hypothetical protein JCM33374_g6557 [Metschnikowia sp. JCM 33374]